MLAPLALDRAALIAAHQATDATAALLLYATEGAQLGGGFGDVDVVSHLAEAIVHAIDISATVEVEDCDAEYRSDLANLRHTCARFIEGWAG